MQTSVRVDIWIEVCLRCAYWTWSRWHTRELENEMFVLQEGCPCSEQLNPHRLWTLFIATLSFSSLPGWWRSEPVSLLSMSPSGRRANPNRGPWYSTVSDDVMQCDMNIVLNMCTCKTNSAPPGASITPFQAKYVPSRTTNNRNCHCKEHTVFIRMCSLPIWNMPVCQTSCI